MFLNKIKNFLVFSFFIFLLSTKASSIEKIEGVPSVTDGDTIKINGNKIRLFGIDAPEVKQSCKKPFISFSFYSLYKKYNCGVISTEKLRDKISNKKISCLISNKDRYGRFIGECFYKKLNLNSWMVKNGYAAAYLKYSKKFVAQENQAKKNKLGIWQGPFINPWEWRKKNKN